MNIDKRYNYVFNRLKKIDRTFESLCEENTELSKANHKLRSQLGTFEEQMSARERVIKSISDERDLLKNRLEQLQAVGNPPAIERIEESSPTELDTGTSRRV